MPLKDLGALGERLKEECKLLALVDVKLPSDFKENYARYIDQNHPSGYASIKFGEYSAEIITTTKKRVLLPNSWFFTAASLSEYISEILEYRTLILAALNGMDTKAIAEESRSGNFPNEIGEKIQQACASEEDAELVVIALGSTAGTIKEAVDELREEGVKAGLLKIRCFRPFPGREINEALKKVEAVAILDRSASFGAEGGPVFLEVRSSLFEKTERIPIINYIYGLGGRDIKVEEIKGVYQTLQRIAQTKRVEKRVDYLGVRE